MRKIEDILNISYNKKIFNKQIDNIIPPYLQLKVDKRIEKLERISEKHEKEAFEPTKGIKEVYLKFTELHESGQLDDNSFNYRELRILSFTLNYKLPESESIFESNSKVADAIILFEANWRDSYLSGLLDCLLNNWDSKLEVQKDQIRSLIIEKLKAYNGSRDLYLTLKQNWQYFEAKGNYKLGALLANEDLPAMAATDFLHLPDHWIDYPYFSGFIYAFVEKSKSKLAEKLEGISTFLEAHSNKVKGTDTSKLIVSKIICYSENDNESVQDRVKDLAFEFIGDPVIKTLWLPNEKWNSNHQDTINKARVILNEWLTRQFISVFFEKCINDYRRKKFWLRYSKEISAFKVFGPRSTYRTLKSDERISKYLNARFQTVPSKKDVSAFMFNLNNHRLIEFSDPGYAFYAYLKSNNRAPSFEQRDLQSVDSFRNGNMPWLVRKDGYYLYAHKEEGRLSHSDGVLNWEETFSKWLTKIVGKNA